MDYITSIQASEKWNISQRRVAVLCSQGRINGAVKAGKTWLIPSSCDKPEDKRTENFEYKISEKNVSCVAESGLVSFEKTDLMLNPVFVENARTYFAGRGKTLSQGINEYLSQFTNKKVDYSNTYPEGFFNLFGCAPDIDFPDDIEDSLPEDVVL